MFWMIVGIVVVVVALLGAVSDWHRRRHGQSTRRGPDDMFATGVHGERPDGMYEAIWSQSARYPRPGA